MQTVFSLEIVTPERNFFSGEIAMAILKTPEGEIGILKGHMPIVAVAAEGRIKLLKDGKWYEAALLEGFFEVKQDKTIILTDGAQWLDRSCDAFDVSSSD